MPEKDLYQILGLGPNATAEEIRRAYLLRAKVLHPDRFDQKLQPEEWQTANKLLQELNEAYSRLRDAASRAAYDRDAPPRTSPTQEPKPTHSPPGPQVSHKPNPEPTSKIGHGNGYFGSLPKAVRQRLQNRAKNIERPQVRTGLGSIGWNYLFELILIGWVVLLVSGTRNGIKWSPEEQNEHLLIGTLAACLHTLNVLRIFNWHFSPLSSWLIVTPLYLIKTKYHRFWYWPLIDIKDVKATHKYRNGSYTGTEVNVDFGERWASFSISPESTYKTLVDGINIFREKQRVSANQGDWVYFSDNDDFGTLKTKPLMKPWWWMNETEMALIVVSLMVSLGCCFILLGMNGALVSKQTQQTNIKLTTGSRTMAKAVDTSTFPVPYSDSTPLRLQDIHPNFQTSSPKKPAKPIFSQPEIPFPANGNVTSYAFAEAIAPLKIQTEFGSNYYVKLVDSTSNYPVLTVFIRSGMTVDIHVPLGNYNVKYASGAKWYGSKYLFGPETGYSKADSEFKFTKSGTQVWGYTLTLYAVPNGNLHTEAINPEDF